MCEGKMVVHQIFYNNKNTNAGMKYSQNLSRFLHAIMPFKHDLVFLSVMLAGTVTQHRQNELALTGSMIKQNNADPPLA